MINAVEKLAQEIERCAELREQYRSLDGMPGVNVAPVVAMLNETLIEATRAAGSNDAITVIQALQKLEGFTS